MKITILMITMILLPLVSSAHGDHPPRIAACGSTPCTQIQIEDSVPSAVEILARKGKIEASWTTAKIEKVEKKDFKKGPEWVATLLDEKQVEGKKRRYIFITLKGYLNGSNLTGE